MTALFIFKTVLLLTGLAVWVFIMAIVCGFLAYKIRTWSGWKRLSAAWKRANGDA